MPTLLQINVSANSGSHGKIADAIGCLAMERGWRSVIAYGRAVTPSRNELIRIGSQWDVVEHVIESRLFDNHGLASRNATRGLIRKIEELKPDIIHLHEIHGYYLNYRILFNYLNKCAIPVVWTFHDTWAYTGHCGHYGSVSCEKWKTLCENCPLMWKDYPKSIIDRSKTNYNLKKKLFTANNRLHIVTVSKWLEREVRQSFLKDKDIRVISNGVDLSVFHPTDKSSLRKVNTRFQVLGVASQWGKLKGLEDFYQLRECLPQEEFDITLVGLSEKQMNGLPTGIKGVKRTESVYQLAELYSSADVFCNLTYADTFPTTNIESLACGTPVITYKTNGSPEIIDEETGYVFERGDVCSVANQIIAMRKKDDRERVKQSELCRRRAETNFAAEDCFRKYISLYDNLLAGGG